MAAMLCATVYPNICKMCKMTRKALAAQAAARCNVSLFFQIIQFLLCRKRQAEFSSVIFRTVNGRTYPLSLAVPPSLTPRSQIKAAINPCNNRDKDQDKRLQEGLPP